ncbi:MAG TPA: GAF domain-containing protein [Gammaproteobacteria bacterium]|nr:GAF domain-containing protein [Gammaproteobacteria bacterium]
MSFELKKVKADSKSELYADLLSQAKGLLHGEHDRVANAANFTSLLYHTLPDLNWVGFYFMQEGELLVGPFQGKPACVHIAMGKGVCGTAAQTRKTQLVPDVDAFPGHIFCDGDSRSELVVPLVYKDEVIGVLDLDSPKLARFDREDQEGLEALAKVFLESLR